MAPGPQGAEIRQKKRGRIYHLILSKVCPDKCFVTARLGRNRPTTNPSRSQVGPLPFERDEDTTSLPENAAISTESDSNLSNNQTQNKNYNLSLVFCHFPARLGPETRSNGSSSKNGAERT